MISGNLAIGISGIICFPTVSRYLEALLSHPFEWALTKAGALPETMKIRVEFKESNYKTSEKFNEQSWSLTR